MCLAGVLFWGDFVKFKNPFKELTKFEMCLWLLSVAVITISFLFSGEKDVFTVAVSLIGVTALIFVAKGYVIGQVLTVVFALFYGVISFYFKYYGEMITYVCMTAPIALVTVIEWIKHPYKGSRVVEVNRLSLKRVIFIFTASVAVTAVFCFILKALGNANLLFSTISVTTSFIASSLTFYRSPYYALAYASNDLVLIVLWILASIESISYLPMVMCFVMFFANDIYGFINWRRMQRYQEK